VVPHPLVRPVVHRLCFGSFDCCYFIQSTAVHSALLNSKSSTPSTPTLHGKHHIMAKPLFAIHPSSWIKGSRFTCFVSWPQVGIQCSSCPAWGPLRGCHKGVVAPPGVPLTLSASASPPFQFPLEGLQSGLSLCPSCQVYTIRVSSTALGHAGIFRIGVWVDCYRKGSNEVSNSHLAWLYLIGITLLVPAATPNTTASSALSRLHPRGFNRGVTTWSLAPMVPSAKMISFKGIVA